ncbi:hypothetical protein TFLX_05178 [Thermoflexales bacterium]|nr:hypothetical protein TFLX_05178 [Thermoflexales bacterium]
MGVRFVSPQEAVAFVNWLNFQGITRRDIAAAIESDFGAAQVFFGAALMWFRVEQERRAAVTKWLERLGSERSA